MLVSAGAGSGKTRVLVERLARRVADPDSPVDVDRFLIITYTRAAAAELRERITARLAALAAEHPSSARLRRQTALAARARIGTIHGFCASLLRENAHALGVPQDFRVADELRCAPLRAAVLSRVLEQRYARIGADADFRALADSVGAGRDDRRLEAVVLSLHQKMTSHLYPELWAEECLRAQDCGGLTDAGQTLWGGWLLEDAGRVLSGWEARLARAAMLAAGEPILTKAYLPSFQAARESLRALRLAAEKGWDAAREALPVQFPRLLAPRRGYDAELAEQLKAEWNACKDAVKKLEKRFLTSSEQALDDLRAVAPAARALLSLTLDFAAAYGEEKQRLSLLDYADLEHLALRLLVDRDTGAPTAAAREISERFAEVMVDEYQDVNAVQDAVFTAVSRGGENLFLVGDVKQSIYRFRLADPSIFLRRSEAFARGEGGERVLLQQNFRSRPELLRAVNHVFENLMTKELGELDYDADARLLPGRPQDFPPAGFPAARFTVAEAAPDEDEEDPRSGAQAEAAVVAAQLRALMDEGATVLDGGAQRPLRWGDCAILLRAPGSVGADFRAALEERRIPVQSEQGADFFAFDEVTVMLHLLALADNPRQDLPLISVLRSALAGLSPDELAAVRAAAGRDAPFYEALVLRSKDDEKCRNFLLLLEELRRDARDLPLHAFLWRAYARTGALAVAAALPGGAARRDNLLRLTALAQRFEENGWRGLSRFLRWLEELRESGRLPAEAPAGGDAVRILSIHKSKGLEFPVVFLAGLGHRFNRRDLTDDLPVDASLGLGLRRTDPELGVEYPTLARAAVTRALQRQSESEELRVLYVAMTRAKDRLYLSCALKNAEKRLAKLAPGLRAPLEPCLLEGALCPADWLLPAALLPGSPIPVEIVAPPSSPAPAAPASPAPETASPAPETDAASLSPLLDYVYPHSAATTAPAKLTATELKSRAPETADAEAAALLPAEADAFRMPDFGGEKAPLRGAALGTATHRFLQYADLARAAAEGGVAAEKARLLAEGKLLPEEAGAVDEGAVAWFFSTDLGALVARAAASDKAFPSGKACHSGEAAPPARESVPFGLRREFRFSLLADAGEWFPGAAGDELLLQGIVDCCVFEPDGVTVLDYKTDRVSGAALEARAAHYEAQLRAYVRALKRLTGLPVKRAALVFLRARELREPPMEEASP